MLGIPSEPLARRHLFRIPTLDKARIRPTGCADENFSGFDFARKSLGHASTKSHTTANANRIAISRRCGRTNAFRFAQHRYRNYYRNAGWSSLVARQAHNLKAAGSNPAPATNFLSTRGALSRLRYPNREGKYYIGLSDDVSRRINQHNFGDSRWTRGKGPWILIWQSGEMNLSDTRKLELSLKRQKGGNGFYRMIGLSRFGS